MNNPNYQIEIAVETTYIEQQSVPNEDRYVFAYTITIENAGTMAAQLISRHWVITDGSHHIQEVRGEGVVGEQPNLAPGAWQLSNGRQRWNRIRRADRGVSTFGPQRPALADFCARDGDLRDR